MPPELPLRRPSEISISGRFVRTASRLDLSFLGARVYLLARIPSLRLVRTSRLCCASCLFIFPKGTTVTLPPSASSREERHLHGSPELDPDFFVAERSPMRRRPKLHGSTPVVSPSQICLSHSPLSETLCVHV
ncbi:hypothetical protein SEVIR_1G234900v4 [Setaria viridis]|uniref:Uncharacterized protein n=2 Tax=Setaria TaxID=4554 RepID=A0A368PPA4_SETIT|nr:hypothetical protein SETIT_1G230700v2 [Setaria italica]TKW40267.1 hypothetical protein SEVIR_1G234900v2 [Setaria viridis]